MNAAVYFKLKQGFCLKDTKKNVTNKNKTFYNAEEENKLKMCCRKDQFKKTGEKQKICTGLM